MRWAWEFDFALRARSVEVRADFDDLREEDLDTNFVNISSYAEFRETTGRASTKDLAYAYHMLAWPAPELLLSPAAGLVGYPVNTDMSV